MGKRSNRMVIDGEDYRLDISTGGKGAFDWRNAALKVFLEVAVGKSRDFFEALPEDEKTLNINVSGPAWKESGQVLQILNKNGVIDKLLSDVKKEIDSIPW
ncbi:MAG TPA: hypothetical protein DCZ94_20155 [Lentisphaeria bacterium]|nr:MAG: hypothetical protein A2X48_14800 [Lentisphaerae bacterium GWF2_49_21]HBC89260.1 hypothetical protein [Lentisphaeria bacterium]